MLAWYDAIQNLINKTGDERNAFVRRHTRSISAGSARSVSSDGGLEEDEADEVPFSANQSMTNQATQEAVSHQRPSPGGRFPSDIQVERNLQAPLAPSSGSSSEVGNDITTASGGLQGAFPAYPAASNAYEPVQQSEPSQAFYAEQNPYEYHAQNAYQQPAAPAPIRQQTSYYANNPPSNPTQTSYEPPPQAAPVQYQQPQPQSYEPLPGVQRHDSTYGDWMAPAAGGAAAGALGAEAYRRHQQEQPQQPPLVDSQPVPERHPDHTAAPAVAPVAVPAPMSIMSEGDSLATTPSTVNQSFLDGPEVVPAATSAKAVNGGSKPPGVRRNNTDISVSDLHVPGEYPKISGV